MGNHYVAIALEGTDQYMLYRQKDHSFCCTLPFQEIQPLSLTDQSTQYFKVKTQGVWNRVLRLDANGFFTIKFTTVADDCRSLYARYLAGRVADHDLL